MNIKIICISRSLILYILILLNLILISEALAASNATNFGNKILWASNRKDVQFDIFKMDTDGQNVLNLIATDFPSDNLVDEHAIWSPDESKIVWVRGGDIWTMNADGTGKTQLTTTGDCGHPSYSPDGSKIVYVRHGVSGLHEVWNMNSNGTGQALLFFEADTDNVHPSYSPTGTKIVLARDTDRSNKSGIDRFEIWTIDTNGTNPVRIYPPPGNYTPSTAPSYSPDGSKIVFARDTLEDLDNDGTIDDWNGDGIPDERDGKYEVWVMNSDGTNLVKLTGYLTDGNFKGLTPPYNDVTPYFSGLGTEMDFVRDIGDLEIFKMNADGSNQVNLTDDPNQDSKVVESTCGCNPLGILFDFGDAPDPNYPSKIASNGAFHVDVTKEWLGSKVDRETDSKQINKDKFDDGIILVNRFTPSTPNTVRILVNNNGLGIARYDMSDPQKIIYVNGWADWNGDGDWTDGGEKIIGTGSGNVTCSNIVGFDTVAVAPAGGGITTITCSVTPPAALAVTFYTRFRLDYGEDAGVVQNISGTLNQEKGEAKYGEVEDYRNIMDFGDAPDDTQGPGLLAYPGVPAKFPTLFNTANSSIPGNKGAYHVILDEEWLSDVSPTTTTAESDALIVDADFDDAFPLIIYVPGASPNTGWVLVPVTVANEGSRYLNILLDQNHDGKWQNGICKEHIVADGYLNLTPGTHWILTPAFGLCDLTQSQWMRVTLTTEPIGIADWDGSAPPTGFSNGETEDWIMDETISPANIVPNDGPPGIPIDDPVPGKVVPTYDYMFDDQDPNDGKGVVGGHAAWVWQPWPPPPGTISAVIDWPQNSMTDFMLHVRNTNNVGPNPVDTPIGSYNTVVGGPHLFLPDGRGCWRVAGTNLSPAIGALGPNPHDGSIPMAPSIVTEDTANTLNVPAAIGGPGDVGGFLAQWGDRKEGTIWACIHDLVYDPGGITIETIPATEVDEVLEPIAIVEFRCTTPTAIHLSSFNVLQQNSYNLISWSTGTERDTEGFYILRSTSANGPYTRLIPYAIESKGGSLKGSSYSFIDMNVSQSINYYYKLEEVDVRGNLAHYGPVAAMAENRSDNSEQVTEVTPYLTLSHQGGGSNEAGQKKTDTAPSYTVVAYSDGPAKFLSGEVVDEGTVQGIRSMVLEDRSEKIGVKSKKSEVSDEILESASVLNERGEVQKQSLHNGDKDKGEGVTASPVSLSFRIIDAEGNEVAVASLEANLPPPHPSPVKGEGGSKGGILDGARSGDFPLQNQWDRERITLTWYAAKPVKGFHILRSTAKDGRYQQITKTLIPYIGTGIEGVTGQIFRFTYTDRNVQKGKNYYYKLEPILREEGKTALRQR